MIFADNVVAFGQQDKYLAAWEQYFDNKNDYWDNRDTKRGKQPDFKHKTTGEVIAHG